MTDSVDSHIAIIGGTGPEGRGLALRWAMSGARVTIGSRSAERAEETAAGIRGQIPGAAVAGATNLEAVAHCDVAVVALPLSALDATLAELADTLKQKLVISVVAALDWIDGRPRPAVIPEGSAAGKI